MLAVLAAAVLTLQPQAGGDVVRPTLVDVCLPYVAGEARAAAAADALGFATTADDGETRQMATADESHLLRLTTTGTEADGNLNRVCVLQARRGSLATMRAAVAANLEAAGFRPDAEAAGDRPIWTRGGVTVSLRQNEGRAALMRVTFSSLDAEGL